MPRFASNLTMLFTEVPLLDGFERAAQAGFEAVEFLFAQEWQPAKMRRRLDEQGGGVGREVLERLIADARHRRTIILYSVPGKESFYRKLGFMRLLTAMAIFQDRDAAIARGHLGET